MPLVLTQNDATESGHVYADELGVEYEYPVMYRNLVRTGEPFVYYRGRRRRDGSLQPQVYLGAGVVGRIRPSSNSGLLLCDVEDFEEFRPPVPFKLDGKHIEPLGKVPASSAGLYFRRGVRAIDDGTFATILAATEAEDTAAGIRRHAGRVPWASPETAHLVDEIAMEIAADQLASTHDHHILRKMPHNNPGYDIRVEGAVGEVRYVEVKGTTHALPHFFMSEGERLFSREHDENYSLLVVHDIDLKARTGTTTVYDGAVDNAGFELRPVVWEGVLAAAAPNLGAR